MFKALNVIDDITDMSEEELAKVIKKKMHDKKITQIEMGKKIGYRNLTISNWVIGKTRIPAIAFIQILKHLGYKVYIVKDAKTNFYTS